MNIDSLDPRVNRLKLPTHPSEDFEPAKEMDQWQTYEVFHQEARGQHHQHVGSVHAPNAEMAILYAKEQYARRFKCVNIWVVKTADVYCTEYEDADMFEPASNKAYREASGYKNTRSLIDKYKKQNNITIPDTGDADPHAPLPVKESTPMPNNAPKVNVSSSTSVKKAGIVIGKKK